jgi:dUTP pyrophosphatase
MKIKIKKTRNDAMLPRRAHYNDAGGDVYSPDSVLIKAHSTVAIDLGISLEIPDGFCGLIVPRSGHAKKGIVAQIPPIDSGYRGSIHAIVINTSEKDYIVGLHERVGQLIIVPVILADFVEDLGEERGIGAFNSTGK